MAQKNGFLGMRIRQSLLDWFTDYCKGRNTTMTQVLTSYIESLRSIEEQEKQKERSNNDNPRT